MGFFSFFKKNNTLYFPGCTTYFKNNDGFQLYRKIFLKLGIDHRIPDKHLCSGLELLEAGYEQEAREIAKDNLDIFTDLGIKKIITNSPPCYKMFTQNYTELLPFWEIEIENIWDTILKKLRKKHHLIKNSPMKLVTYHDSCYLGRHSGIYEEPRKILESIGYEIKELENSHQYSFCAGSCGNLPFTNKTLADKIAKEKILQAKRIKVKTIIVSCFDNYNLLNKNSKNSGIKILELSEVLANALDIKIIELPKEEDIEGEDKILLEEDSNIKLQNEIND